MTKPLPIITDGKDAIKELAHTQHHLKLLAEYYPDLVTIKQPGDGSISFFSQSINPSANHGDFTTVDKGGNLTIVYISPYREIDVGCDMCSEPIRVGTNPSRYIVLTKYNSVWDLNIEPILICTSFEDTMKRNKISKHVISKTKLFTIDFLQKEKFDQYHDIVIPSSIKKLLVFS